MNRKANCRRYRFRDQFGVARLPIPRNDAELELLTAYYFGMALHARFDVWRDGERKPRHPFGRGSYQVMERYNDYHGKGWRYSESSTEGYDHSAALWRRVFGNLTCGGIANNSYGQFNVLGHRQMRRLEKWAKARFHKEGEVAGCSVRRSFLRLAARHGGGENRTIRGDSVLIDGRADGASGASSKRRNKKSARDC